MRLKFENIKTTGFLVELTKTRQSVPRKLIEWSPELKSTVDELVKLNKKKVKDGSVICNRSGRQYTINGFSTLWAKAMNEAMEKSIISEKFQFRDIRHKSATDTEKRHDREVARMLLGHTSQVTTARYIDSINSIEPVKFHASHLRDTELLLNLIFSVTVSNKVISTIQKIIIFYYLIYISL